MDKNRITNSHATANPDNLEDWVIICDWYVWVPPKPNSGLSSIYFLCSILTSLYLYWEQWIFHINSWNFTLASLLYIITSKNNQFAYLGMSGPYMNLFFGKITLLRWHSWPKINTNILRYVEIGPALIVIHFFNWNKKAKESNEQIQATAMKSVSLK